MKLINWVKVCEVPMPRLDQRPHRASLNRFCRYSHAASAPPLLQCLFPTFQGDGPGSDAVAMSTTAKSVAGGFFLGGKKTCISDGGVADIYMDIARTGEAPRARSLSAFRVSATWSSFEIAERIDVMAPHPLARIKFNTVELPESALIGKSGDGFKIAMLVLDVFRSTVGAAVLGFARRALDEALVRVKVRKIAGAPLAELQLVQGHLADMAKLYAIEAAQRVVIARSVLA